MTRLPKYAPALALLALSLACVGAVLRDGVPDGAGVPLAFGLVWVWLAFRLAVTTILRAKRRRLLQRRPLLVEITERIEKRRAALRGR